MTTKEKYLEMRAILAEFEMIPNKTQKSMRIVTFTKPVERAIKWFGRVGRFISISEKGVLREERFGYILNAYPFRDMMEIDLIPMDYAEWGEKHKNLRDMRLDFLNIQSSVLPSEKILVNRACMNAALEKYSGIGEFDILSYTKAENKYIQSGRKIFGMVLGGSFSLPTDSPVVSTWIISLE
jgi:hypothetical protein